MQALLKYGVVPLFALVWLGCVPQPTHGKLAFWDTQRRGANGDTSDGTEAWFEAAADVGLEFVRLSPAEMKSDSKDFLIGDIDNYTSIPEGDLSRLKAVLDRADSAGVKVVITVFGLPGARWRQHNDNEFDYRLWEDERFHDQCARFWSDLATALKDHPAVVGYSLINEPHPERKDGFRSSETPEFETWLEDARGTAADLNLFYQRVVDAIRQVDAQTPIILDSRFHASPEGFKHFEPVRGEGILYSFHFYSPWTFTTYRVNKGRYSYPDEMPARGDGETIVWTREDVKRSFDPVHEWARRHGIASHLIIAAEIGCDRRVAGAQQYLADVIGIMNENDWHWAFYSFRSKSWDGMDYELGTEKLNWAYWQGIEAGKSHNDLVVRHDNPLWGVITDGLNGD